MNKSVLFIKRSIKWILICLIVLAFLFGLIYAKIYYVDERFVFIGKNLAINIDGTMIVDYTQINKRITVKDDSNVLKPWFSLWGDEKERNKLISYLKENNLKIKPGLYYLNQADRFEKILKILKFEPIR